MKIIIAIFLASSIAAFAAPKKYGILNSSGDLVGWGYYKATPTPPAGGSVVVGVPPDASSLDGSSPAISRYANGQWQTVARTISKPAGSHLLRAEKNLAQSITDCNSELISQGFITNKVPWTTEVTGTTLADGKFPTAQLYQGLKDDLSAKLVRSMTSLDRSNPTQKAKIRLLQQCVDDLRNDYEVYLALLAPIKAFWLMYAPGFGVASP